MFQNQAIRLSRSPILLRVKSRSYTTHPPPGTGPHTSPSPKPSDPNIPLYVALGGAAAAGAYYYFRGTPSEIKTAKEHFKDAEKTVEHKAEEALKAGKERADEAAAKVTRK
ncbi:hypothetical protein H0H81_004396 [Sphagnurus paluster]|uniref:Uncharacterized protein n=1 Tax=Sphagnurus paluster TaxID=117069 RepID=A0A9P7GL30_9AGAR|nr:hypothetical protein H0H81_004396 [Sphagnurus paluster]